MGYVDDAADLTGSGHVRDASRNAGVAGHRWA